ncbi:unnamed protein product [Aphanomyces euteiches]
MVTAPENEIPKQDGHLKFVYHKDGASTRCFRFAKTDEVAENPVGTFVFPTVASWYSIKGDGLDNANLRNKLNTYDYGSASLPTKDGAFLSNLNKFKPLTFPGFTQESIDNSK